MKKLCFIILSLTLLPLLWWTSQAQSNQGIRVSPNAVNVNTNGPTVVQVTFGTLRNQRPAEGCWCGELISAAPDAGLKCNPAKLWGCTPARFDFSTASARSSFTDIMTIPDSVARRAYQAAVDGATSSYFYVRRFVSTNGGRDEYTAVTCRMGSGGATTPFALTDVKLSFASAVPVLSVKPGDTLPAIKAELVYNGTGRLKGRWEIVKPGDKLPDARDLLTEATLPLEERGTQQRYLQLSTFNVLLLPTGKFVLPGPDVARLPTTIAGQYLILLRIEATDDKDGDANLLNLGGPGVVHNGAVAGFSIPMLRYNVGSAGTAQPVLTGAPFALLSPVADAILDAYQPLDFRWSETGTATLYQLEVEDAAGNPLLSALLPTGTGTYHAPPWLKDKAGNKPLRWRVLALDQTGKTLAETAWQGLRLIPHQ
ncbi:MAG: hypothetical protein U0Y68_13395 [Blastocatellia bacterium]